MIKKDVIVKEHVKSSPARSFKGFKIIKLLKGQRKTIVALIGGIIGYLTTNQELIALGSAFVFECIVEVVIYWYKKR